MHILYLARIKIRKLHISTDAKYREMPQVFPFENALRPNLLACGGATNVNGIETVLESIFKLLGN